MNRALCLAVAVAVCAALPGPAFPNGLDQGRNGLCWPPKNCNPPKTAYSRVLPGYPHVQWNDAGGYCGSQSIQTTVMVKGAWISEEQVRKHSSPGGGHDNEILATNIDATLLSLKVKAQGFDYKNLPTPQGDAYLAFLKQQLANGHPVAWMIMLGSAARPPQYPVYPVEPPPPPSAPSGSSWGGSAAPG